MPRALTDIGVQGIPTLAALFLSERVEIKLKLGVWIKIKLKCF